MVTPGYSLLPPNATRLERSFEAVFAARVPGELAEAVRNIDTRLPESVVPWLAAEWFLADFTAYFPDARALIDAGLPWLQVRGTAAAVKQALSWIGLTAPLEEDGARLQLDPGAPLPTATLPAVKHLVGASIPAHVQLYRLYHSYDLRPLRLDASRLDDALLDDDSGVWEQGVKNSFGTRHAAALPAEDLDTGAGMTRLYSTRVWDDDSWRLDAWRLDSDIQIDAASGQISHHGAALPADIEEPLSDCRLDRAVAVLPIEADPLAIVSHIQLRASALADEMPGWTGPWAGFWREPIPSRMTFEVA